MASIAHCQVREQQDEHRQLSMATPQRRPIGLRWLTGRSRIAYSPSPVKRTLLGSFFQPYCLANSSGVSVNCRPSSQRTT